MRVLITGASGFVGQHLAAHLRQVQPRAVVHGAALSPRETVSSALDKSWPVDLKDEARARRLLRQRDLAGAERAYRALTRRWPGHPDLHGELGNVYVFLDRRAEARAAFERARGLLRPLGPSLPLRAVERWLAADGGGGY